MIWFSYTDKLYIFHLNFKENNENQKDLAAHGIFFEFYYRPKPSQTGQKVSAAAADARLVALRLKGNLEPA